MTSIVDILTGGANPSGQDGPAPLSPPLAMPESADLVDFLTMQADSTKPQTVLEVLQLLVDEVHAAAEKQTAALASAANKIAAASKGGKLDPRAIEKLLAAMPATTHKPAAYEFHVKRDGEGFITAITATPLEK